MYLCKFQENTFLASKHCCQLGKNSFLLPSFQLLINGNCRHLDKMRSNFICVSFAQGILCGTIQGGIYFYHFSNNLDLLLCLSYQNYAQTQVTPPQDKLSIILISMKSLEFSKVTQHGNYFWPLWSLSTPLHKKFKDYLLQKFPEQKSKNLFQVLECRTNNFRIKWLLFHREFANFFRDDLQVLDVDGDNRRSAGWVEVFLTPGSALHQNFVRPECETQFI